MQEILSRRSELGGVPMIRTLIIEYAISDFYVCYREHCGGVMLVSIIPCYAMRQLFNWKLIRDTVLSGGSPDGLILEEPGHVAYEYDKYQEAPLDRMRGFHLFSRDKWYDTVKAYKAIGVPVCFTVDNHFDDFMGDGTLNRAFCDFPLVFRTVNGWYRDPRDLHSGAYRVKFKLLPVMHTCGIAGSYMVVNDLSDKDIADMFDFIERELLRVCELCKCHVSGYMITYTRNYSVYVEPCMENLIDTTYLKNSIERVRSTKTMVTLPPVCFVDYNILTKIGYTS
jgi:hypothetical protein